MSSAHLATLQDEAMLLAAGTSVLPRSTPSTDLPVRHGEEVSRELAGRYLLRYVTEKQIGTFGRGSQEKHFVTPTPLSLSDLPGALALPNAIEPRKWVLLLDAKRIPVILGPRWVECGTGIEYILPNGFPADAVFKWEIEVR